MNLRGIRIAGCALAIVTALGLSSCSGDDSDPAERPTATQESTAPSAEDEAVSVLEAFWAERVRVESSGAYDTANFDGILNSRMIEPQLQQYQQFGQSGFRRIGEPQLRDFTAEVDGDSAIATVCVQEDEWGAEADIKIVEPEPQGWYASSHRLERTDGAWLIVDTAEPPSEITC